MAQIIPATGDWITKALEIGGVGGLVLMLVALVVVIYLWKVMPLREERRKKQEDAALASPPKVITPEEAKVLIEAEILPLRQAIKELEENIQEALKIAQLCPVHMANTNRDIERLSESLQLATANLNAAIDHFHSRLDSFILTKATKG
jgi:hypothetical protein